MSEFSHDEGQHDKYFHVLPNMYDDDLDPYEYRLIGHYKRVGVSWEGTRKIAKVTRMSVGKVNKTRTSLEAKGLLRVERLTRKELKDRGFDIPESKPDDKTKIVVVAVRDVMKQNILRYQKDVHTENTPVHEVNTPVHGMNDGVHEVNERITPKEGSFPQAKKPRLDPEFEAIAEVWGTRAGGWVSNLQGMLCKSKNVKGDWLKSQLDIPATVDEIKAFCVWAKRLEANKGKMPTVPATIERQFDQFRTAQTKKVIYDRDGYIPVEERTSVLDGVKLA